jgi:hypothetical protein
MVLIWLFLLDLSGLASGQYAPIEVVLTMFVAFFCSVGILRGARAGRLLGRTYRTAALAAFWVVQVGATEVSLSEPVVNR